MQEKKLDSAFVCFYAIFIKTLNLKCTPISIVADETGMINEIAKTVPNLPIPHCCVK